MLGRLMLSGVKTAQTAGCPTAPARVDPHYFTSIDSGGYHWTGMGWLRAAMAALPEKTIPLYKFNPDSYSYRE